MTVETAVLGSPSLTDTTVCEDIRQNLKKKKKKTDDRAQELCESRGGRPRLPAPNIHYRLCGSKATLTSNSDTSWLENVGHNYVEVFPPAGFTLLLCQ